MRVAALYDVHGNLPALEAALAEVDEAGVDLVLSGGDLLLGPQPAECLDRLRERGATFIRGNCDREVTGGTGWDDPLWGERVKWTARRLSEKRLEFVRSWPKVVSLEVDGLGQVLFCHGSPRSDEEMILKTTPDEWLREMLAGVEADVVVCGHTHMQFDRRVDRWRVVNAGSVGLAYGAPGAHWLLVGPDVEHRRTPYDADAFADRVKMFDWPIAERFAEENIRTVPSEQEALEFFEPMAAEAWEHGYPGRS
jgi:putative phosphoesterase